MKFLWMVFALFGAGAAFALSDRELDAIGKRVWNNECGGTVEGLTSWNEGEAFASLGIGHFIWYPKGARGPFEESFPKLVAFLADHGVAVAEWLKGACPWKHRADFMADRNSPRMLELRALLAKTAGLQSRFLAQRMKEALPKLLAESLPSGRANVKAQFERLASNAAGTYALIDYVNFKGEGIKESERYGGEGWGLLQVLEGMSGNGRGGAREFGESAARVLARRVRNAPPERNEARWLKGWLNRVQAYGN